MPKTCFVVGPIGEDGSDTRDASDMLLHMIIKPAAEADGKYIVERADTIRSPGLIDAQVIEQLLTCDLVIADMTERNPNAFYEIGIRHMAQLPAIHLQKEGERIPFDLSLYRAIHYSLKNPAKIAAARLQLKSQIDEIEKPNFQTSNPVIATRGFMQLKQSATPTQQLLFDEIISLKERLEQLEGRPVIRQLINVKIGFSKPIPKEDDNTLYTIAETVMNNFHRDIGLSEITFHKRTIKSVVVNFPRPPRQNLLEILTALEASEDVVQVMIDD